MARRTAYLHIGLPGSTGPLTSALATHSAALAAAGVQHPAVSAEEMFRAAIEIRRDHRAWGYQRREVEGTWAEICRRAEKGRGTLLVSQELLAGCDPDQISLLLDTLPGFRVHAVITVRDDPTDDPTPLEVIARWERAVGASDRIHVLRIPADVDARAWTWQRLGELAGYDAARLPLTTSGLPAYLVRSLAQATGQDTARVPGEVTEDQLWWATDALSSTLVEVARLREHNRVLEQRNEKLEKKRSKLKRRLAEVG